MAILAMRLALAETQNIIIIKLSYSRRRYTLLAYSCMKRKQSGEKKKEESIKTEGGEGE